MRACLKIQFGDSKSPLQGFQPRIHRRGCASSAQADGQPSASGAISNRQSDCKLAFRIGYIYRTVTRVGGERGERGQSLVEMAIIAPLLLLMFIGVLEVGWAIRGYVVLLNAAAALATEDGDFERALTRAMASLDEGMALETLEKLKAFSQRVSTREAAE